MDIEKEKLFDAMKQFILNIDGYHYHFDDMPEILRDNEDFVLPSIQTNGCTLQYASERLRDKLEIVEIAVDQDPRAFQFCSPRLKDFAPLVLRAIEQYGMLLEFASDRLRDDPYTVFRATENNANALEFASERLRDDLNFICRIFQHVSSPLGLASERVQQTFFYGVKKCGINSGINRRDTMLTDNHKESFFRDLESLIKTAGGDRRDNLLEMLEDLRFRSDNMRYFILKVLEKDGLWLQHLAAPDSQMVITALRNNPLSLQYCSHRVRWSRDFVLYAIARNGMALEFAKNWNDHEQTASVAVDTTPEAIQFVSERLKNNVQWLANRCTGKDPKAIEILLKFVKTELHQQILHLAVAPQMPRC